VIVAAEVELVLGAAGTPATKVPVPRLVPSSLKSTVPEGAEAPLPADEAVTTAVTTKELPGEMAVVAAGVTAVTVELGCDVTTTAAEFAAAYVVSPLYSARMG
jgi:hypothetical protein